MGAGRPSACGCSVAGCSPISEDPGGITTGVLAWRNSLALGSGDRFVRRVLGFFLEGSGLSDATAGGSVFAASAEVSGAPADMDQRLVTASTSAHPAIR